MPWESSIVATLVFCGKHFHKFSRLLPVRSNNSLLPPSSHIVMSKYDAVSSAFERSGSEKIVCLKHTTTKRAPERMRRFCETWNWSKEFIVHTQHCSQSKAHSKESTKKASSSSFTLFFSLMQHNPPECRLPSTFHSCFSCVIPMEALFSSQAHSGESLEVLKMFRHTYDTLEKERKCFDVKYETPEKETSDTMHSKQIYEWKECREQLMKSIVRVFQLFIRVDFDFSMGKLQALLVEVQRMCNSSVSSMHGCVVMQLRTFAQSSSIFIVCDCNLCLRRQCLPCWILVANFPFSTSTYLHFIPTLNFCTWVGAEDDCNSKETTSTLCLFFFDSSWKIY